jgi:hypothetical protein
LLFHIHIPQFLLLASVSVDASVDASVFVVEGVDVVVVEFVVD